MVVRPQAVVDGVAIFGRHCIAGAYVFVGRDNHWAPTDLDRALALLVDVCFGPGQNLLALGHVGHDAFFPQHQQLVGTIIIGKIFVVVIDASHRGTTAGDGVDNCGFARVGHAPHAQCVTHTALASGPLSQQHASSSRSPAWQWLWSSNCRARDRLRQTCTFPTRGNFLCQLLF